VIPAHGVEPRPGAHRRRRVIAGGAFAVLSIAASVLVARRLTHSSWPLDHAEPPWLEERHCSHRVHRILPGRPSVQDGADDVPS